MRRAWLAGVALAMGLGIAAQTPESGPAQAASGVEVSERGPCPTVKAGDVVHYSLTLDGADEAQAVYADLQMLSGRGAAVRPSDLPMPGSGAIGGGGNGVRDAKWGKIFHFAFTVPAGAEPGVYRGLGVQVAVRDNDVTNPLDAVVSRRARERVQRFCIAVSGRGPLEGLPVVTGFKGGPIERK